jgi:uncharacterized damage-inducible protein DinB
MAQSNPVITDLVTDVKEVQKKITDLVKAMPDAAWNWRPGTGVRSTGEVVQHVAADNYLIPGLMGAAPPAATKINPADYKTVQAYETRTIDRAAAMADLDASFTHLYQAMNGTSAAAMSQKVEAFGRSYTRQQFWILATTHLHEHLGQLIAYARSNNIVPPWSRGGN